VTAVGDHEALLLQLLEAGVEFIVVGGVAGVLHGAARVTYDVDVVYRRTPENMLRLAEALSHHAPYLRGAPAGLPFQWDAETLRQGLNFTLTTGLGDLDLLGEIAGGGDYSRLLPFTRGVALDTGELRVLTLAKLIEVKRAAGRPKDLEAVAELEVLLEESERADP
jgi:hypothetical protein